MSDVRDVSGVRDRDVWPPLFFALLIACGGRVHAQTPPLGANPDPATLCDARAENRQLDFWIGEWDVRDDGKKIAESSIQRLAGSCSVLESYSQPDGYSGKSINFYDATLKKWRQTWVDKVGTVSEFTGELRDGALIRDEIIATPPAYMLIKLKHDVGVEIALPGLPPSVVGI
jgi:hypothetical protein